MANKHRRCAKCRRTRAEDMTVTYHRFPNPGINNIIKARAWATYCWPDKDWSSRESLNSLYVTNKVLCGRHFKSTQFYDDQRQKLSIFAVPDSPEVEELLNNRENVYNENVEQSSVPKTSTTRTVFSRIENTFMTSVVGEPSKSKVMTSKTNPNDQNVELSNVQKAPISGTAFFMENTLMEPVLEEPSTSKHIQNQETAPYILAKTPSKKDGVLSAINVNKINEMTPRELKLYNICKKRLKEISRLRKKIKNKKGLNVIETLCEDKNIKKICNLKNNNSFLVLLQNQIINAPKKPKGRRYSLEQKIMALSLYKRSPACYRLLRRLFALPCQSNLNKLLNRVPLKPGINNHIFDSLKNMSHRQNDEDNVCVLSFDEMAIRKHLYYDTRLDQIQGFQDHGKHGRCNQIASKALVFMLSGIRKKWKQPIAFYLSHSINADRMTVILKEVLTECINSNMNIVATVCDLSTTNLKVLKTLGVTIREPYFQHEGREIVSILDPPHLLKCTRNLFIKHNVECVTDLKNNEKTVKVIAKWSHIQSFYELDKSNPNFVFAPALTDHHLHPNVKQQMRVKFAAQIFSHSVTAGILTKIASNELPSEAQATAFLLQKFDELFDACNADSADLRGGKQYCTNLTSKSPHLMLFRDMRKFISTMKYVGSKTNPPSQNGWIHTLNGIERLWKNLRAINIHSLSTRRLNQDPLENCFGCIRYNCGSNNNPTVSQFTAGIKTAIISNLRHSGQKTNCEDDAAVLSNNLYGFLKSNIITNDVHDVENIKLDKKKIESIIADAVETIDQVMPESQACGYVCGFIYKKLRNKNCPDCRKTFLAQDYEPIHLFTSFKEYNTKQDSLIYVKKQVVQCVEVIASIINKYVTNDGWRNLLKKEIMGLLNDVEFDFLFECGIHLEGNIFHVKMSSFFICIKRYIIVKNRELEEEEKKKALERKMKILKNK